MTLFVTLEYMIKKRVSANKVPQANRTRVVEFKIYIEGVIKDCVKYPVKGNSQLTY